MPPGLPLASGGRDHDDTNDDPTPAKQSTMWTKLNFGKHTGRTLPQVVLSDPNWFFWAVDKEIFKGGPFVDEVVVLAYRATHIKIPKAKPKDWEVEYRWDRESRFLGCGFVKAKGSFQARFSSRLPHLDLAYVRRGNIHDKRDCRRLIRDVRALYFDGLNLTKQRCEAFFDRKRNFVKVKA